MITENTTNIHNDPHHYHMHAFKRISWSAIFVGAFIAVGLSFLLNLFGIALGLSAFAVGKDGSIVLAVGGLLGIIIGVIASMITAGYAAGYLGRLYCPQRNLGIIYGFTTWTVALLLSAVVAAHVGAYISSYSKTISNSVFVVHENKTNATQRVAEETAAARTNEPKNQVTTYAKSASCLAFSVFVLFFIGAFASCLGSCWGMSCKRED